MGWARADNCRTVMEPNPILACAGRHEPGPGRIGQARAWARVETGGGRVAGLLDGRDGDEASAEDSRGQWA